MPRKSGISESSVKPKQGGSTRGELLAAAAESFAQHGLRHSRVRDIAASAGTNLASINYHFGGKEQLYLAVLEAEVGAAIQRFPMGGGTSQVSTPQARLELAISNLLQRFVAIDASSRLPRLMMRELLNPTAAADAIVEKFSRPQFMQLSAVVGDLLGPKVTAEQVRLAGFSVLGQCLFYLFARPIVTRLAPDSYSPKSIAGTARHIAQFSLAGLKALKEKSK